VKKVTCYLLHIMEDPDRDSYRDPGLKDVIGLMPRFFCAKCQPLRPLLASDSVKCMRRSAPCWKPEDEICADDAPAAGQDPQAGPADDGSSGAGPFTF
jgi:hypothetical protein